MDRENVGCGEMLMDLEKRFSGINFRMTSLFGDVLSSKGA